MTRRFASESRKIQGSEDPLTRSCLPQETEMGHLRTLAREIPLQSAETHRHAEGTNVILKGLSAAQYNGQGGKIPPSAQRQHRKGFQWPLNHGEKISVKLSDLKVKDEARLEDSMPPRPQATDEALHDESWPIWEHANSMPSLEDDGNKTLAAQRQKKSRFRRTHFQQVACRKRRRGRWHGDLYAERRDTAMQRAPK